MNRGEKSIIIKNIIKNWCFVKKQHSMCQAESHGRGMLQEELHEGGFEAAHKPPPCHMSRLPESQLNTEVKDIPTWLLSSKLKVVCNATKSTIR